MLEREEDPAACKQAMQAFEQKVNSSLETYVRACESQAGVTIPNRTEAPV
jgi:hypothetical protein